MEKNKILKFLDDEDGVISYQKIINGEIESYKIKISSWICKNLILQNSDNTYYQMFFSNYLYNYYFLSFLFAYFYFEMEKLKF